MYGGAERTALVHHWCDEGSKTVAPTITELYIVKAEMLQMLHCCMLHCCNKGFRCSLVYLGVGKATK